MLRLCLPHIRSLPVSRVNSSQPAKTVYFRPNLNASILAQAPDGAPLAILNHSGGWYLVNYKGTIGYAKDDFVTLNG